MHASFKTRFLSIHESDHDYFIDVCKRLSFDQLWQESAKGLSPANIICHAAEMEGFWIDWGLCGNEFKRQRQIEFDRRKDLTNDQLIKRLKKRKELTQKIVKNISPDALEKERVFHNQTFTGIGILEWHLHHLGIHVGHVQMKEQALGVKQY